MRRLILAFAVAAPIILIVLWTRAPLLGIGVLALSHALLLYPTLRPNVQWLGPVMTRFATTRNDVDESFLAAAQIPRAGVKYFDSADWNYTVDIKEQIERRLKEILLSR